MKLISASLLILIAALTVACGKFSSISVPINTSTFAAVGMPLLDWKQGTYTGVRKEGLSKSLVYGGVTGSTIKLTYRENYISGYGNEFARPAFSQELTYDLNSSRRIRFQDVELDVTQANNEGITFVLTKSPLPTETQQ